MSPETWVCPECSTVNLAHEIQCRVCGYDKPADAQTFTLPEEKRMQSDAEFLRELADRVMHPSSLGLDESISERLHGIADGLDLTEGFVEPNYPHDEELSCTCTISTVSQPGFEHEEGCPMAEPSRPAFLGENELG